MLTAKEIKNTISLEISWIAGALSFCRIQVEFLTETLKSVAVFPWHCEELQMKKIQVIITVPYGNELMRLRRQGE